MNASRARVSVVVLGILSLGWLALIVLEQALGSSWWAASPASLILSAALLLVPPAAFVAQIWLTIHVARQAGRWPRDRMSIRWRFIVLGPFGGIISVFRMTSGTNEA